VQHVRMIENQNVPAVEKAMNAALHGSQDAERWDSFRLALQEMREQFDFLCEVSATLGAKVEVESARSPG